MDCEGVVADGYFVEPCVLVPFGKVWKAVTVPLMFILKSHPDARSDAARMRSAIHLIKNFFMRNFLSGKLVFWAKSLILNRLCPKMFSYTVLCARKDSFFILSYYGDDVKKEEIYIFHEFEKSGCAFSFCVRTRANFFKVIEKDSELWYNK